MALTKDWQDTPSTATPLSAAAMEDLETRAQAAITAAVAAHAADTLLHPQQKGYAQITTTFTHASSTPTDVTGLVLTGITVGLRPVRIWLTAPQGCSSSIAGDVKVLRVLRGSTVIGSWIDLQASANSGGGFSVPYHDDPGAGTYTYKVQIERVAGTGTISLLAAGSPYFAYPSLRVEEVAAD